MSTFTPHRLLTAVGMIAVLAACGAGAPSGSAGAQDAAAGSQEHGGHGQAAMPAEGARQVTVTARSFAFEPAELSVDAGEQVAVHLTSTDTLHDFVVEGQDFHVSADRGDTAVGALAVADPGRYTVYCSVPGHREAGMEATLVVE